MSLYAFSCMVVAVLALTVAACRCIKLAAVAVCPRERGQMRVAAIITTLMIGVGLTILPPCGATVAVAALVVVVLATATAINHGEAISRWL